ncbi:MAG: hypothetical protein PWR07_1913 [Bacillota bacterium]|nr:hypothetical protein [Bacillota bacterium]
MQALLLPPSQEARCDAMAVLPVPGQVGRKSAKAARTIRIAGISGVGSITRVPRVGRVSAAAVCGASLVDGGRRPPGESGSTLAHREVGDSRQGSSNNEYRPVGVL